MLMSGSTDLIAGRGVVGVDVSGGARAADGSGRDAELREIIGAYNEVTERLQASHERLSGEVIRLHGELASANAALQRSKRLAALGEMAAGIAHEVRNPLASIQLYAQMLREDLADRPDESEVAEKISRAVRGLDAIVHDVLAFSREMKPGVMEGSAQDMLESAAEGAAAMIESAGVEVTVAVEPDDLMVWYDPNLMHRAMLNLIRNAVQAVVECDERRVWLSACADECGVKVEVRDSGAGIGEDAIERIFNPFFTTRDTGTGLGLAIVHRIVDAHGGSISVENGECGGAVFSLILPSGDAERSGGESRSER